MDCLFCKIVKDEIPCFKIFEDEHVMVFLDINPVTKGHCLVIPKIHYENIFDIDEEILKKVIVTAKKISKKVKSNLSPDGIRISQSNGAHAGQAIFHYHLHIIPRYEKDGVTMSETTTAHPPQADFEELKSLALQLY